MSRNEHLSCYGVLSRIIDIDLSVTALMTRSPAAVDVVRASYKDGEKICSRNNIILTAYILRVKKYNFRSNLNIDLI